MTLLCYYIVYTTLGLSKNLIKLNNFPNYLLFPYIVFSIVFYLLIVILWATLFTEGLNSFKKRFLFWLKNMSVRGAIPIISLLIIAFITDFKLIKEEYFMTIRAIFELNHLMFYIIAWLYPEQVKSSLYGSSNKIPKLKVISQ